MSEVKNKKKKSSIIQVSIGVLAVIMAILIIIMMGIVSDIQGTARIVNYTGLVRGETQRLIKLELSMQQENEMIHDIRTFIDGLRNGNDELNLVRLNDVDFQNKMQELDDKFSDLYKKIYLVRFKGARNTDIIPESEEFFVICDEATGLAEKYSQKKATSLSLLEKYITADIVVLMLLIGYEFIKAIQYAAMNRLLQRKVYLDDATGLPNKNKCEELLSEEEPDADTGVCSFDLNNLRRINDSRGHEAGDAYIRRFAICLRASMPAEQFVGRAGGDEFLAVTHGLDREQMIQCLEKVRRDMTEESRVYPDTQLSYAVGFALACDFPGSTMRELFNCADKNMYINKNHVKREEAAAEKHQGYQLLKLLNQHGSNFSDCLYCDARMDTYRAIRSSENFFLASDGAYSGAVEQILSQVSATENIKALRKQLQLETLNEKLMENNSPIRLFCQYTANGISHKGRLTLLYLDANASGQLHHFILGFEIFQNMENTKTDEKTQLNQYYEQMKQSILENGNYVDALLESAQAVYSVDLTGDRLEKIFYHTTECEFDLNIKFPCSYDEYCLNRSRFVTEDTQENYRIVDSSAKLLERFRSGTKQVTVEYREQNENGEIFWLQKTVLMSQDTVYNSETGKESTVIHGMILFKNTSVFHEKEQQERERLQVAFEEADSASKAKTEFLNRMSHDIRTPINGIMGMLEIIRKNREDHARVDDSLEKIYVSSSHLLALVNDVLDMSKLESRQAVFKPVDFDLSQLMRDVSYLVKAQIMEMGLTHRTHRQNIQHVLLSGYPLQLRQIMLNLFSNAIKYNKKGGFIDTGAKEISFDGTTVVYEFFISDTGIGMSEAFLKNQLFEPFSQEKSDARTQYKGTGLGMSIVKGLIRQMNGSIEVESSPGEGTTFTFRLPFRLAKEEANDAKADTASETGKELEGIHVLLVEDNEINMEIAEFYLTDRGATLDKAWNGKEALEQFERSPEGTYDIILMDVMMPVMNGLEASRQIRSLSRPDGNMIPILAMTAQDAISVSSQCRQYGMDDYVLKPADPEQLTKMILKYVKTI